MEGWVAWRLRKDCIMTTYTERITVVAHCVSLQTVRLPYVSIWLQHWWHCHSVWKNMRTWSHIFVYTCFLPVGLVVILLVFYLHSFFTVFPSFQLGTVTSARWRRLSVRAINWSASGFPNVRDVTAKLEMGFRVSRVCGWSVQVG